MSVTADEGLLAPALRTDAAHGMQRALLAAAALLLVGIVAAFRMPRVVGPGARIAAMVSGTDVPNARAPD
jgi:hypothetical protein